MMNLYNTLKTNYSVSDFVGWHKSGSLKLSPNFQRRAVWKPGAKSYLIDTIIRGLPVPIIFLRDLPSDLSTFSAKREVVDGQQRLRTVLSFVLGANINNYKSSTDDFSILPSHQPEYGKYKFADLPKEVQQRILDYQFSVHAFPSSTDDSEILEIFSRMNSTGVKLNPQELRNAEFFGAFKTMAVTLASEQLGRWRKWNLFNEDQLARMEEVELTSDLMVLILDGITAKSNTVLKLAYKRYDAEFVQGTVVADRFSMVMDIIEDHFSKSYSPTFFKVTRFYAFFASIYEFSYGLRSNLIHKKRPFLSDENIKQLILAGRLLDQNLAPSEIIDLTRSRTSHAKSRKLLTEYLLGRELINAN